MTFLVSFFHLRTDVQDNFMKNKKDAYVSELVTVASSTLLLWSELSFCHNYQS